MNIKSRTADGNANVAALTEQCHTQKKEADGAASSNPLQTLESEPRELLRFTQQRSEATLTTECYDNRC